MAIYSAIIDILALCLIIGMAIHGAKNGFIKTFFHSFGSIIALFLAVLLCSTVANFLESSYGTVTNVTTWLEATLTKVFGDEVMNTTLRDVTTDALNQYGIAGWIADIVLDLKNDGSIPLDTTLNQIVCPVFGYYLVCILSAIVLFILFKIIFFIIGSIVKSMHSLFLVAIVDKNLGLVLGIIRALFYIQFLLLIITAIPLGFFQDVMICVNSSYIAGFINRFNVYGLIVNAFTTGNVVEMIKSVLSK